MAQHHFTFGSPSLVGGGLGRGRLEPGGGGWPPAQGWRLSLCEQASWHGQADPSQALASAWRRSASRVRRVALAVPDGQVWQQAMAFDTRLQGEDLHFQIGLQLRDLLPWDMSQVSWDYALQDGPNPKASTYGVFALPVQDLQPMLDWVRRAGLLPWVVDIRSQAMQRWRAHAQRLEPGRHNDRASALAMGLALRRFVA